MRIVHLGLLSLALLGSSSFAHATTADTGMRGTGKVLVSTRDLDLATDTGVRTARARVRRAAERVCSDYPRIGILPSAESARCRAAAVHEADVRIVALASRAHEDRLASAGMDSRTR